MKRLSLFIMVVGMVLYSTATGLAVEKFNVDGIDVILKTNTANEIIAAEFCLKGGIPYYGTEQAGIEAVLFRTAMEGTQNYPKEKLRSELARMGTNIGYNAGHDFTSVNMQCLDRYLDDSWKIFADVISHPLCEESDLELVKERQLNDIRQTKADADGYARMLSDALYYRGHPYAVSPNGSEASVGELTSARLLEYLKNNVTRSRALVVLVGNIDKARATKLVSEAFGKLPQGQFTMPTLPEPGGEAAVQHELQERELPTCYVRGYFPTPPPGDPADAIPMFVGLDILRDRLFEEVRTKRNLTYAVSSSMANRRSNYGLLYVTSTNPTQAVSVMLNEVHRIQDEPVPAKDLHDKIKVLTTEELMGEQTNAGQAGQLALYEISGKGYEWADKRIDLIQKVTPEEIQRVMKKYAHNFNFTVLGDVTKGREMLDAISTM